MPKKAMLRVALIPAHTGQSQAVNHVQRDDCNEIILIQGCWHNFAQMSKLELSISVSLLVGSLELDRSISHLPLSMQSVYKS